MLILLPTQKIDLTGLPVCVAMIVAVMYFVGFLAVLASLGYLLWSIA